MNVVLATMTENPEDPILQVFREAHQEYSNQAIKIKRKYPVSHSIAIKVMHNMIKHHSADKPAPNDVAPYSLRMGLGCIHKPISTITALEQLHVIRHGALS